MKYITAWCAILVALWIAALLTDKACAAPQDFDRRVQELICEALVSGNIARSCRVGAAIEEEKVVL